MEKIKELKNWLKTAAVEIRLRKSLYKEHQRNRYDAFGWNTKEQKEWIENSRELPYLRWDYRHKHIAYSELRGKTRNQIELKCNNPASEKSIDEIKEEYGRKNMTAFN